MQNQSTAAVGPAPASDRTVSSAPTSRWTSEDWMAVVLGFLVIATVVAVFHWKVADLRNVVSTYRWTTDAQIASLTPGSPGCCSAACSSRSR